VSDYLRLAFPEPVAISGFSNAHGTPAQLEVFWRELLSAAPAIGTVLFQDALARGADVGEPARYLRAVRAATDATGRRLCLWSSCSSRLGARPRFGRVRASAAPFPRVAAQLQVEAVCAPALIAFSAADYLLTPTRAQPTCSQAIWIHSQRQARVSIAPIANTRAPVEPHTGVLLLSKGDRVGLGLARREIGSAEH